MKEVIVNHFARHRRTLHLCNATRQQSISIVQCHTKEVILHPLTTIYVWLISYIIDAHCICVMSHDSSLYLLCNVTQQKSFCLLPCVIHSHPICEMSRGTLQICLSITCLFQKGLFGAKNARRVVITLGKLKFLPHFLIHFDLDMLWGENKISALKLVQNDIIAMKFVNAGVRKEHNDKNRQSIKIRLHKKPTSKSCITSWYKSHAEQDSKWQKWNVWQVFFVYRVRVCVRALEIQI